MTELPIVPRILVLANQKGGVGQDDDRDQSRHGARGRRGEMCWSSTSIRRATPRPVLASIAKAEAFPPMTCCSGKAVSTTRSSPTAVPRLSIAPSTLDLLGVELEIAGDKDRAFRLKRALAELAAAERHVNARHYSYILIDCPPSLNLLTINALASADAVVVPLQCEFFALEGLSQLLSTVEQVKRTLNPKLSIHGVVLTMFDAAQ